MKRRGPSPFVSAEDEDGFASVKPGPAPKPPPAPPRIFEATVVGGLCRVCGEYGEHYCPGCGQFYCKPEHARVRVKLSEHNYREHRAPVS